MKKWQYAHVAYIRNRKPGKPCVDFKDTAMSGIDPYAGIDFGGFLDAAGEQGWELCGTLIPFAVGKRLSELNEDGHGTFEYTVEDALDIQWLIFKREK